MKKLFLTILLLCSSLSYAKKQLPILVADDVRIQFDQINQQYDIHQLSDLTLIPQSRDLVDLIILTKALKLGGCDCELQLHDNAKYGRNIEMIISGKFVMSGDTLWRQDIERYYDVLLMSDTVIERGQYDVGLYTSANNQRALRAQNNHDIRTLTAASNRFWSADWQAMRQLKTKRLAHVENWSKLINVVEQQLVDFTFLHFRLNHGENVFTDLVPIPNIKAVLWDSRHFAISKLHPDAQYTFEKLQKGLAIMHQKNALKSAYQQIGLNHPSKQDWRILNFVDKE